MSNDDKATRPYFPNCDVKAAYMALSKNKRADVRRIAKREAVRLADPLDCEPRLYCISADHIREAIR